MAQNNEVSSSNLDENSISVDSEVSLLVDVSGSVSSFEYDLQLAGYANAFDDPDLFNDLISEGINGQVAINLIVWSGVGQQQELLPWTLIDSVQASQDFADSISQNLLSQGGIRPFNGSTAPGSAIDFAIDGFFTNDFDGDRLTIDVSGDGRQNSGINTATARDEALAAGIDVINGIVVGTSSLVFDFYEDSVIGGLNADGAPAFVLQAEDFAAFSTAAENKLRIEFTPPPQVSITDVALVEGNSGSTSQFVFDVSLNRANDQPVSVDFETENGTAKSTSDYLSNQGTLTFAPQETVKTITVEVNGDGTVEQDETFFINLSNVVNGVLANSQGEGTILNDDDIQLSNDSIDENSADGTVVGDLSATDAGSSANFSFDLTNDAGGRFEVVGTQLQVADGSLLDFESSANHTITVNAVDEDGNSYEQAFTITVNDINEAPVAQDDNGSTGENTAITVNLIANDTDVDGDTLSIKTVSDAGDGTVVDNGDGTVTYTPNAGFGGDDSFSYTVTDGFLTDEATVTINVDLSNKNQAPDAQDDSFSVDENKTLSDTVLANDNDPDGDALTVTLLSDVSDGSLTLNADGTFDYTPNTDFTGDDQFTYEITDGEFVDSAVVDIKVNSTIFNPVNDAPVAVDDTGSTRANTAVTLNLLANDTDEEDDVLSIAALGLAGNGTVVNNGDGTVTYTPNTGFIGKDTFTYEVSDGELTDEATVTVSVAAPPSNDSFWFSTDRVLKIDGDRFSKEDIVEFDDNTFNLFLDGSDVGLLGANINAFDIISDTEILLSFDRAYDIAGIGTVDDSDVVKFTATSLGENSAGSFELLLDGSDIGLSKGGEDIDALTQLDDGSLLLSTVSNASFSNGLQVNDEDLVLYNPNSGDISLYVDGSDVGLSKGRKDINAVALRGDELLLSTSSNFSDSDIPGVKEDVFSFTPTSIGEDTAGNFDSSLFFDGSQSGFGSVDLVAIDAVIG